MIYKVFAIKDIKVGTYAMPFYAKEIIEARRNVERVVNDSQTNLYHYPQDFELWVLGEFDDTTGVTNNEVKVCVEQCLSMKRESPQMDLFKKGEKNDNDG